MKLNNLGKDVDCMACIANIIAGAPCLDATHTHEGVTHALAKPITYEPTAVAILHTLFYLGRDIHWSRSHAEYVSIYPGEIW